MHQQLICDDVETDHDPVQARDEALEQFGRVCEHFLLRHEGRRPAADPRSGTMVYNWAIKIARGKIGPGILLSHLVYRNQRTLDDSRHRLKACSQVGLRDEDLNDEDAEYLRRPWRTSYEEVFFGLGLSEGQFIDAADFLEKIRLVESHKIEGHRGRALVLSSDFHSELSNCGRLAGCQQSNLSEGACSTWLNASEVIAMPRLTQAMVLARWLRIIEWGKRNQRRYDNTHLQIAEHLGLWSAPEEFDLLEDGRRASRTVQNALKKLYESGVLRRDYVAKRIRGQKPIRIPSPTFGRAERERLEKLTVEALARHYKLPVDMDLTVFWRDEKVAAEIDVEQSRHGEDPDRWIYELEDYEVGLSCHPQARPPVKFRRRRRRMPSGNSVRSL